MAILYTILGLIVFIVVLGIIIIIHEGGHFYFSKKAGILCHEFSIGMGPLIAQKKKGETSYSIRAIPLGGYVSMAGEETELDLLKDVEQVKVKFNDEGHINFISLVLDNPKLADLDTYNVGKYDLVGTKDALKDELFLELTSLDGITKTYVVERNTMVNYQKNDSIQIAPYDRTFTNKKWGERFMSVFAGPLMNFVLALVIFFMMGLFFGYADTSSTKVNNVSDAALAAGLENNDVITSINGTTLSTWDDLSYKMSDIAKGNINSDGTVNITYLRDNQELNTIVKPVIYILSAQLLVEYKNNKVVLKDGDWINDTTLYEEGYRSGDAIIKINNTSINGIDDLLEFFTNSNMDAAQNISITFECVRNNNTTTVVLNNYSIYSKEMLSTQGYPQTKVMLGVETGTSFNIVKLLYMPWVQTGEASVQILSTLKLLFSKNSGVTISDLSGPVGIANLFTTLVQGEDAVYNILYWTGLLSVNIGIINLLPLPALDGGRLAFLLYEAITRKKPTPKVENTIHNIGFILLMALFVFVLVSDIIKCF